MNNRAFSYTVIDSPLGKLTITSDGESIIGLAFGDINADGNNPAGVYVESFMRDNAVTGINNFKIKRSETSLNQVLYQCVNELRAYFAGQLTSFTVPIKPIGTTFRMRVWNELQRIPYGETISYKQLAERSGNIKAVRAVGGANHHNPIVIIIPCHRVIGSNGSLTGFGGGIENKSLLLKLELTTARRLGKIAPVVR